MLRIFMKNFIKNFFVILLVMVLSGCFMFSRESENFFVEKSNRKQNFATLKERLRRSNVKIAEQPKSTALLLQSKYFFINGSANFAEHAYNTLDLVLAFADYYREPSLVIVTGYSNNIYSNKLGKALAVERARRIVEYLLEGGIDTTFIYADGKNKAFSGNKEYTTNSVLIEFMQGVRS